MAFVATATRRAAAVGERQVARKIRVKDTSYDLFEMIGKGGNAKVYRVETPSHKMCALKQVNLHDMDKPTLNSIKSEIDILQKLNSVDGVVHLTDWELNEEKETLSMVMECGQSDLLSMIKKENNRPNARLNIETVRRYWKQMLESVANIHRQGIVHSDIKPANFLVSNGLLKLIDFGIAGAVNDDTINITRSEQIGTPNYMSPEALRDVNSPILKGKLIRFGRPTDIWSLGCVLYLMVYNTTPFGHIEGIAQKCLAIINPRYKIAYPETGIGGVAVPPELIDAMKQCLRWQQNRRPTVEDLLSEENEFLWPREKKDGLFSVSQESLGRLLQGITRESHRPLERREAEEKSREVYETMHAGLVPA
ncbi:kinase-like protein [Aulographum hederae CBS 113979]|uniref:Kinase-like protein n=1 Tax=Aulographum hederae CBS 113979 TaxID=1176131 RepID=A0A6G1HE61_9PEZI|nr:kinase-like protein [Aulographum hederae CBS 113979]